MDVRIDDETLVLMTTLAANRILRQMVSHLEGPFYSEVRLRAAQVEAVMLALVQSGNLEVKVWIRKAKE